MCRVIRTTPAIEDVLAISTYIAEHNLSAAERWLVQVDKTLELLAKNPELGARVEHLGLGIRRQVLGNFLVFYRPLDKGIEFLRILHGSRQIDSFFIDRSD